MSSNASDGLNRRLMLGALATLPALPRLSGLFGATTAQAQTAATGPLPSWNDRPAKQGILEFIRATTSDPSSATFVPPEERSRHFRPGWHIVGGASDLHPGGLLPRPGAGSGQGETQAGAGPAVQDRADGRLREDREAFAARLRGDRGCDAHWNGRGHLLFRSEGVDRRRQGSSLEAAIHRVDLSTDAGSSDLLPRQRLQDLHRHRWRRRTSCVSIPIAYTASRASR